MISYPNQGCSDLLWPLLYADCSDSLRLVLIKYLFCWKVTALSITLNKCVRFETGLYNCLEYYSSNWDNYLLTIFVIELFKTSRRFFTSHVYRHRVNCTETLDDLFNNFLISCSLCKRLKCIHHDHSGLLYQWHTLWYGAGMELIKNYL